MVRYYLLTIVFPAQAGIQTNVGRTPAFAGMTASVSSHLRDTGLGHEIDFPQVIVRMTHFQAGVNSLGDVVVPVHVKAHAAYVTLPSGLGHNVIVQVSVHSPASKFRNHVHALYPPKVGVAPIAPLGGNELLADHSSRFLGDEIKPAVVINQQRRHPGPQTFKFQRFVFGFLGRGGIKLHQCFQIV